MRSTTLRSLAGATALALSLAACGGADDGATVRTIGGDGSISASASGSGSASASGVAGSSRSAEPTGQLGGYEPVSDVTSHAAVTLDVCEINELLDAETIDWDAVDTLYREGENSVKGDGTVRTLAGFATSERDEEIWNAYVERFGEGWLDGFVTDAIEGTGAFEGEADAVRRQGVQKGLMNQVLVAWTFHELVAATEKAAAGELDPASGAPHNWDEAWAFYHGAEPSCAPFATAEKRGADFGTGSEANDAILAAMEDGLTALTDGDVEGAETAAAQVQTQILRTYLQATVKYAAKIDADLEAGDEEAARIHQAEGWAFFRVVEPLVAEADASAADTIVEVLELDDAPRTGAGETVRQAVDAVLEDLGLTAEELGTYEA